METYFSVIQNNSYIRERSTSGSDPHSFTTLTAPRKLTQSQNIQLGHCMEHFFSDVVKQSSTWKSVKEKNKKGEKETDHVYRNETEKKVIYLEQKDNINLDTEKSKSTAKKVKEIVELLKVKYDGYTVEGHIFAARYLDTNEDVAKQLIQNKYSEVSVIGVNAFLSLFGFSPLPDYDAYKQLVAKICETKFGPVSDV